MQECLDKKIDAKISFLERKIIEFTKCPDSDLAKLKQTLTRFKYDYKKNGHVLIINKDVS